MMATIFGVSCTLLATGALYMIFATCYDDGIIGKVGLFILGLGALSAVVRWLSGEACNPPPHVVFIAVGAALFMARHLVRFWQFSHRCTRNP